MDSSRCQVDRRSTGRIHQRHAGTIEDLTVPLITASAERPDNREMREAGIGILGKVKGGASLCDITSKHTIDNCHRHIAKIMVETTPVGGCVAAILEEEGIGDACSIVGR